MQQNYELDSENGILFFPRLKEQFGINNLATYDNGKWGNMSEKLAKNEEEKPLIAQKRTKVANLVGTDEFVVMKCPLEAGFIHFGKESQAVIRNSQSQQDDIGLYELNVNAVLTSLTGQGVMTSPSDCAIIVIAHPDTDHFAYIHVGSKEAFVGIYEDVLDLFSVRASLENMSRAEVYIFPYICPQHYEYGLDFIEKMSSSVDWIEEYCVEVEDKEKKGFDFVRRVKDRMRDKYGISSFYDTAICTYESAQNDKLYSYRLTKSDEIRYPRAAFTVAVARSSK
ncbi:MAG: laccase domain-containing protein [Candidatus Dojkabacteria bacterium]|nr:MAG: laccase domain-containing protein [Candidatus Dojkabacteria bacterium]